MTPKHTATNRHDRPSAFTLLEVMIAIGIFAIGMIAVAAIFPTAAILQKQTIDVIFANDVAANVENLLAQRPIVITLGEATTVFDPGSEVHRFTPGTDEGELQDWWLRDRAYPATALQMPIDGSGSTGGHPTHPYGARFFWVPVILGDSTATATDLERDVFVFVLNRGERALYVKTAPLADPADYANPMDPPEVPGVVKRGGVIVVKGNTFSVPNNATTKDIKAGDWLLDNNGVVYRVKSIWSEDGDIVTVHGIIPQQPSAPDTLWYGKPADVDRPSPCKKIVRISQGALIVIP